MENASRSKFSFDNASVYVLAGTIGLAAALVIPIASVPFISTKVSLLAAGAITTLALFILARLIRQNIVIPPATLLGALWIVPGAYILSALFSSAGFMRSFFGAELETDTAGFVVLVALLGTLAAVVLRKRGEYVIAYRILGGAFLAIVAVQLLFVAIAQVSPSTVNASTNIVGSFIDFGMLAGLGVALSLLALRFLTFTKRVSMVLWAGILVSLFLMALVNATLVWILTGLVALGLFIEAVMRRRPSSDDSDLIGVEVPAAAPVDNALPAGTGVGAPLAVLAVSLFFIIGGSTIGSSLATGLGANTLDVRPSWQATLQTGGHTFASSPVFGTGPGTFGEAWLAHRDRALNETPFWTIDFGSGIGYVPTSFITTGAVGALAWILFFGLLAYLGGRFLMFRAPVDPFLRFVSLSSFVGALYVFALMVFTVPGPILIALAFFLTGVFVSSTRHGVGAKELGVAFARNPRIGFVIVFGLTLILLGSVFGIYLITERYLGQTAFLSAGNAINAGDLPGAEAAAANATLFSPSDRTYRLQAAIGVARLGQIANDQSLPQEQAREAFQATLQNSIANALTATELNPNDYRNWVQLGNVYGSVVPLKIEGAYENAKASYVRARELNPSNPTLPYILAQLEIAAEKPAEAEALLQEAIALKRNYTEAIFFLSQLNVQMGKAREALLAAEAAAYFAPSEPGILFQVGLLRLGTGDTDGAISVLQNAVAIDPNYANAHFFLAVSYATKRDFPRAITELETVAGISEENRAAVATYITELQAGRNPFPASLSVTPVAEPAPSTAAPQS